MLSIYMYLCVFFFFLILLAQPLPQPFSNLMNNSWTDKYAISKSADKAALH